ncbi:MAG: hypothetical protein DMF49_03870 [Acidobacteria bacterium]|nr:MAG: hypothetical protein DMF49_03870 [Acidobacteriota bacterium]
MGSSSSLADPGVAPAPEVESLCREILERYEEVNLLYRLAGSLTGVFVAEEICWRVLQEAASITRARSGCVFLHQADGGSWSLAAEAGEEARRLAEAHGAMLTGRGMLIDGEGSGRWSLLSAPMPSASGAVGQIVLGRDDAAFTAGDLKLITTIAGLAGVFIENGRLARRMQENERVRRELEIARQIQQSLLPTAQPALAGFDIAGAVRAAEQAGGDYYGYVALPGGKMGIVVADVSGHNIGAAIGMVITRCVVKVIAERSLSPRTVARRANDILCEDLGGPGLFVTAFYGVLQEGGELRYCNAGHHPPLLLRAAGGGFEKLAGGGPGLGIVEDARYQERRVRIERGDMLVLFTDGVLEARSPLGEMFGMERLRRLLQSVSERTSVEARDAVFDAVATFTHSPAAADDITVVVVKRLRGA